ncbi:MAG TPA: hypothetical protein VK590_10705 [Saprospiraceae bacterium]|nr:hypothetical protein [Saprospiraceae bacterium]
MVKKILLCSALLLSNHAFAYANLEVKVNNVDTFVNTNTNLRSEVEYGIQNNTRVTQSYVISYTVCPQYKDCYTERFTITLASQQREQKKLKFIEVVNYKRNGVYKADVTATIKGESNASKSGSGNVTVYNR